MIGGITLQCPTLLQEYIHNIATLPLLSIYDLYSYLISTPYRLLETIKSHIVGIDSYVLSMEFDQYLDFKRCTCIVVHVFTEFTYKHIRVLQISSFKVRQYRNIKLHIYWFSNSTCKQ